MNFHEKDRFFEFLEYDCNKINNPYKIDELKELINKHLIDFCDTYKPNDSEIALEIIRICDYYDLCPPKWATKKIANCWSLYINGIDNDTIIRVAKFWSVPSNTFANESIKKKHKLPKPINYRTLGDAFAIKRNPRKKLEISQIYGSSLFQVGSLKSSLPAMR